MGEPSHEVTTAREEQATPSPAIFPNDRASHPLANTDHHPRPASAPISMTAPDIITNGHHITHGGYVFLFADTTFAMASNYPGSITVASGGDIDFLKPAFI